MGVLSSVYNTPMCITGAYAIIFGTCEMATTHIHGGTNLHDFLHIFKALYKLIKKKKRRWWPYTRSFSYGQKQNGTHTGSQVAFLIL